MVKTLSILTTFCIASSALATTLKLEVSGFASTAGVGRVSIFKGKDGFPSDVSKAVSLQVLKIEGDRAYLVLPNVEPGTYALAAFHDEDNNGKLNTGLFGMPKEAYGFSNDARGSFGPPSFEDASFVVSGEETDQRVRIK